VLRPHLGLKSTKAASTYLLRSALCVTNESVQDAAPPSGNLGNEIFCFFRFRPELELSTLKCMWTRGLCQGTQTCKEPFVEPEECFVDLRSQLCAP